MLIIKLTNFPIQSLTGNYTTILNISSISCGNLATNQRGPDCTCKNRYSPIALLSLQCDTSDGTCALCVTSTMTAQIHQPSLQSRFGLMWLSTLLKAKITIEVLWMWLRETWPDHSWWSQKRSLWTSLKNRRNFERSVWDHEGKNTLKMILRVIALGWLLFFTRYYCSIQETIKKQRVKLF